MPSMSQYQPSHLQPRNIQHLDRETIGKICAGKIIPSLSNVVKELIENSLDANARYIEVRFIDYGKDLIEVSDDGDGIQENDFPSLALPNHTSKLTHYGDLGGLKSFGFRGEALSSIAELADLIIITRHESTEIASELGFNHLGELISVKPTARPVGTTVRIKNLFYTYPVRRKEFESTYLKQFNQMMQFIYPYALGYTHLRLIVTNHINGRKNDVLNIEPKSIKDNIIQLLGCKQMKSIQPFTQSPIKDEIATEFKLDLSYQEEEKEITITGYVSHGDKAPSKLKKVYFFLNRRPANYMPLEKLILSTYKEINQTINPFVLLFVDLGKHEIDISVHPDKRTFSLPKENLLFAIIKSSLLTMFETNTMSLNSMVPSSLSASQSLLDTTISSQRSSAKRPADLDELPDLDEDELRSINSFVQSKMMRCSSPADHHLRSSPRPKDLNTSLSLHTGEVGDLNRPELNSRDISSENVDIGVFNPTNNLRNAEEETDTSRARVRPYAREEKEEGFVIFAPNNRFPRYGPDSLTTQNFKQSASSTQKDLGSLSQFTFNKKKKKIGNQEPPPDQRSLLDIFTKEKPSSNSSSISSTNDRVSTLNSVSVERSTCNSQILDNETVAANVNLITISDGNGQVPSEIISSRPISKNNLPNIQAQRAEVTDDEPVVVTTKVPKNHKTASESTKKVPKIIADKPPEFLDRKNVVYDSDISEEKLANYFENTLKPASPKSSKFFTKLASQDQSRAEDELKKELKKEAFTEMQIIGQFNRGFIIARLDDDVFIIDQHASDERYNFEDLLENTCLESQQLVKPVPLQLTCYQESILKNNITTFERLSYKIEFDDFAAPGKKATLVRVPVSQDFIFGKSEIEDILSKMEETGGDCRNYRPETMIKMIASRACRKSIMINDPLDRKRMQGVLNNMVKLKNPWICAHGRPTIRFLFNINEVLF